MKHARICANCAHWSREDDSCPCEVDTGSCRRYPPTIHTPVGATGKCWLELGYCQRCFSCGVAYSEFPATFANETCGEYKMSDNPWNEWMVGE